MGCIYPSLRTDGDSEGGKLGLLARQLTLSEPPWVAPAGAEVQQALQVIHGELGGVQKLDFIVLQPSVIEPKLTGEVLMISSIRFSLKKNVNSIKRIKLVKMKSFPLKPSNLNGGSCITSACIFRLKGYWSHLNRSLLWTTIKPS